MSTLFTQAEPSVFGTPEKRGRVLWVALLAVLTAGMMQADKRLALDVNSDWRMGVGEFESAEIEDFDDSEFDPVTLPRAWNEDDAFQLDIHNHGTGIAWYRKTFVLQEQKEPGKVYIEFEGARQLAEVWVNGEREKANYQLLK